MEPNKERGGCEGVGSFISSYEQSTLQQAKWFESGGRGLGGGRREGERVEPRSVLTFSRAAILRDGKEGREAGDRYGESARQALKSIKQIHLGIQTKGCHRCISPKKTTKKIQNNKSKKKQQMRRRRGDELQEF